jgi:dipeptidyl aminopeptidase/acylaminoacyl peptidase
MWIANSTSDNGAVYAISLSHPAQPVRVMASESEVRFAPALDGRNYLLMRAGQKLVAQDFDVDKLKPLGEPQPISEQIGSPGAAGISAGVSTGGILVYSPEADSSQLIWFDRTGMPLGTLTEPGPYLNLRLSPDGHRVVLARRESGTRSQIWLVDAGRHMLSRFTSSAGYARDPVWSPDARTIVFLNGGMLFRKDAAVAGDEESIADLGDSVNLGDWSRDGQLILFSSRNAATGYDLSILPSRPDGNLAEGGQPKPYLRTPFNERNGRFSPEHSPRWVAYQSDETGRNEIYIASFPEPRRRLQITSGGGTFPQWGSDGRELFYISGDDRLMAVGLKMGPEGPEATTTHALFSVRPSYTKVYEVTPDGKRILVNQREPSSEALELVVNWPALLKKR